MQNLHLAGVGANDANEQPPRPRYPMAKTPAPPIVSTGYWLLKSEPDVFSWEMLVSRGAKGEPWTGVRNYLARNHMRAMKVGDLGFFYHSNIGKEIVGILRVIRTAYPEPGDASGQWECVDVVAESPFAKPVTLDEVKADPMLAKMVLATSTRLSVQRVLPEEWEHICKHGGAKSKKPKKSEKAKA